MNELYEALEVCLEDIERGDDVETALIRYPDLVGELRPILEASIHAKSIAVPPPSAEIVRRNRVRVLQRAAEMHVAKATRSRRFWFVLLRRVAIALVVLVTLFSTGTGLVRAASTTLPGDHLYPVKRAWEGALVFFTFNSQERGVLELEYENERLDELNKLFLTGRSAQVDFSGQVVYQNGTEWLVSEIPVIISAQTTLPNQAVAIGSGIHVIGQTQNNHTVLAERIELLPSGVRLPKEEEINPTEIGPAGHEDTSPQIDNTSGSESEAESSRFEGTTVPTSEPESKNQSSDHKDIEDNSHNSAGDY